MTIAAAYLTSEGVVLGADSATAVNVETPGGQKGIAQVFDHAQKVFEVGQCGVGRMGVCVFGSGNIGMVSHRTVVGRLADEVDKDSLTVEQAADRLLVLAKEAREEQKKGVFESSGYFLGGWNLEDHHPGCFWLHIDESGKTDKKALGLGEARFAGRYEFFTRLFHGYDRQLPSLLSEKLKDKLGGQVPEDFNKLFSEAFQETVQPLAAAGFKDLPLREAIDFVHAYLHITVKATKFKFGPPICGGPVEIGFISTDRRFRWVCHKEFDAAIREV